VNCSVCSLSVKTATSGHGQLIFNTARKGSIFSRQFLKKEYYRSIIAEI